MRAAIRADEEKQKRRIYENWIAGNASHDAIRKMIK